MASPKSKIYPDKDDFPSAMSSSIVSSEIEAEIKYLATEIYGSPSMEKLYQYQGYWYLKSDLQGVIAVQKWCARNKSSDDLGASRSDVVLATFPKCGTTWFKALIFCIMNKNLGDAHLEESLRCHSPHDFAKWLEYYGYKNHDNPIPSTKILSTHMPYSALPGLIKDSTTPIVYVSRDPKDNVVSLWHFLNKMKGRDTPGIELDKVFYSFCNGVSHYGPFWDHTLSYWHASLESPHKVLFLRYEDMIASPVIHISRLANFIGHPFTIEEEKMGLKERIIDICSFDKLTSYAANQSHKVKPITPSLGQLQC